MDEFEVIYTEEDIKAVQTKLDTLTKSYNNLTKEKKDIEIFVETLREKVQSLEGTSKLYQSSQQQLQLQKQNIDELQKKLETLLVQKNEQDNKLIKVMKEKYMIQQELDKLRSTNEELSLTMIEEMEQMKNKMTSTFQEQSQLQQKSTRHEIQQLQQLSQQKLIDKQMEYEDLCAELDQINSELNKQKELCKELQSKLEYSAEKVKQLSESLSKEKQSVEELKKQVSEFKERSENSQKIQEMLKQDCQVLRQQLEQANSQLTKVEGASRNSKDVLLKLQEECKSLQEIQQLLTKENTVLVNQTLELKKQSEVLQNSQVDLKKQLEKKDQIIDQLNQERQQDLLKSESSYQNKLSQQSGQITELTKRLNDVEMNYVKTLEKIENSENTCSDLLQQIQHLQSELQSNSKISEEKIFNLIKEHKEKEDKNTQIQKTYELQIKEIYSNEQKLLVKVSELNKEVQSLTNQISIKMKDIDFMKSENLQLNQQKEQLQKTIQHRKNSEEQSKTEQLQLQKCNEDYNLKIQSLNLTIQDLSQQLKASSENIKELRSLLESEKYSAKLKHEQDEQKLQDCHQYCNDQDSQLREKESSLNTMRQFLQTLEEDLASAQEQILLQQENLDATEEKYQEAAHQLEYTKNENETLKSEKAKAESLIADLKNKNDDLYYKSEMLTSENFLLKEEITSIKEEKDEVLRNEQIASNQQVATTFNVFSQLLTSVSQTIDKQPVLDEELLESYNQSSEILYPLHQMNLETKFDGKIYFMREAMTSLLSALNKIADQRVQVSQVNKQLKEQLVEQQKAQAAESEQHALEKENFVNEIALMEQLTQQLNGELNSAKQQQINAAQALSPVNKGGESFQSMDYEQLEKEYKIQQSILMDQKQQLKDLKYDLEQKIKRFQEENSALAFKNKELAERAEILAIQTEKLSLKYGEQENNNQEIMNDYMDKVQSQEQEIQNLQQLLEEQDFENVLFKKINQTNGLADIDDGYKREMNLQTIQQAKDSIQKITNHFNLNQK